jgi:N-acetylglucosaminylphosphatidylinositol deacetylase
MAISRAEAQVYWDVFWLTLILLPIALYFKAVWAFFTTPKFQRKIEKRNILYVIAHPDDEAMFFVPSIIQLREKNDLYILCLSNGNFDGLGKTREKEMHSSA